jgi:catechol 2,3-dioxygenase
VTPDSDPESDSATLPDGTRIGRTALRVDDREELTEFYRQVVGLEVVAREGSRSVLGVEGTPLLVLVEADAPARGRTSTGLYHNAFRVPSRGALGDALGRVREHWRLDGASDHRVSEALYLTDPEGNGVEIYRDRPREAWPVAADGRVEMGTDPLALADVAAEATGEAHAPPGTDVGHVHLEVSSLEAFEGFYVDALGFEMRATVPRARFVAAGGYHHHVGANTWNDRTAPATGRGLAWFEVVVPDATALDSVRTRAAERGVSVTDTDAGFELADPDGVRVRLRADA